MPGSSSHGKKPIQDWLNKQDDIKTIVDVGCGQATYPKLLGKKYRYIGIEIWAPYIEKFSLNTYYDKIIIGDIRYIELPDGDCVIFGDVIEHMVAEDALKVLNKANEKYKHMIFSVPLSESDTFFEGKEHYENKHEKHLSAWIYKFVEGLFNWNFKVKDKEIGVFCK